MYTIKGSWSGLTFAVAASNDSGGRKSRIRRSKEERKAMVESFIKKYQKSNGGNFPSVSLTRSEVGGTFYMVREIVREIIQENRVLAPPKLSLEEHEDSGLHKQYPLGSLSMEPQIDLSESDVVTDVIPNKHQITSEENISSSSVQLNIIQENRVLAPPKLSLEEHEDSELHKQYPLGSLSMEPQIDLSESDAVTDVIPNKHHITSEENISSSSVQLNGSYPLELENEQISDGVSKVVGTDEDTSREEVSNYEEQLPQPKSLGVENEKIVTGVEVLDKNMNFDHPLIADFDQDKNDNVIESSPAFNGPASQKLTDEVLEKNTDSDHPLIAGFDQDKNDNVIESSQKFNGPASQKLTDEVLEKNMDSDHPLIAGFDQDKNDNVIESSQKFNGPASQKLTEEVLEKNTDSDHPLIAGFDQDKNDNVIESSQKSNSPASQKLTDEQYHNKNDHAGDKTKVFGERVHTEKDGAQDVESSQPVKPYVNSDVVVETFPLRPVTRWVYDMDGGSGEVQKAGGTLEEKAIQPSKRAFTQNIVNKKTEEKLPKSAVELNGECKSEKVVLNLQNPSLESSKSSSASIAGLGSKVSMPGGAEASNSTDFFTSKGSPAVGVKSSEQYNGSLPHVNNPDKINLETSKGAPKNSTQPETNPFLAFVKALITFMKSLTE